MMPDLTDLYEQLKKEQVRLKSELRRLKAEEKSADEQREGSPFGKREEGATEAFEMEKRMALEKRLNDSQPIEMARLEALPQASMCLKCKASQAKDARGRSTR
jgi:DnaK suppressor protein